MKLSKTGIKVLSAQYRAVLRKCLLINMGLFVAFSANAKEFINNEKWDEGNSLETSLSEDLKANGVTGVRIENTFVTGAGNQFEFIDSDITIKNSDLETNFDKDAGKAGNILIKNTKFTFFCNDDSCKYGTEYNDDLGKMTAAPGDRSISGWDITLEDNKADNKQIVLGKKGNEDDYAYLGANHNFIINNSDVELNGSSILAYEGDIINNGVGKFEIKNSTLTFNDKSSLYMGEKNVPSEAPLIISGSKITMKDSSNISFQGENKEKTKITNSNVQMQNNSSMALNDLSMEESYISMENKSSLSLNNLTMDKAAIVLTGEAKNSKGNERLNIKNVSLKNSVILGLNNTIRFAGNVDFSGLFDPAEAEVDGNLTRGGYDDEIAYNLNSGILKYTNDAYLYEEGMHTHNINETRTGSEKIATINGEDVTRNTFSDGKYALNSINFNGGTLDIANGKATDIKLAKLSLSKESNIILDADLANKTMDRFSDDTTVDDTTVDGSAKLNISKLNLVSDAQNEKTTISFTKNATLLAATNYTGARSGLRALSPIYTYDVAYKNGDFTFTRGGGSSVSDYNPAVYAGSVVGQTLATIQSTINQTAFSSLNNTLPQKDNAWVSVIGFDDTVDMKSFKNVDSEMYSVVGGVNSDAKRFDNFDATYGLYAGYINSEQKYDGNKIEQNGGYIGLDSVLTKGNAEFLAGVNAGYIRNEDKHSFGNDKFDTYFTGVAVKAGYTYDLNNGLSVVPNLYAGYTFVNNEDYTSKSGVKIKNDNLHLFEVAPGVKVNKDFNNGWTGYAQAKYAFIMDNGGDADVNNINLPNISAKDYVEYGLGANKALNDSWSLSAEINRRDGGREGWNGNLNVKYNF